MSPSRFVHGDPLIIPAWTESPGPAARWSPRARASILRPPTSPTSRPTASAGATRRLPPAFGVAIAREPSRAHGALRRTGRDLDYAIVGDGAFRVRDANGTIERSRDGAFVRERDGSLRDGRGRTLLGIDLARGSSLRTGFLESANVDAIREMIDVLSAERSFESAEKVVAAIDGTRQKSANDVARVR